MDRVQDRFHIFVARSNTVNGAHAYRALASTLKEQGLTPSSQLLHLFSGGYRPGMDLLPVVGAAQFSSIYLVDIWMGVTEKAGSVVLLRARPPGHTIVSRSERMNEGDASFGGR